MFSSSLPTHEVHEEFRGAPVPGEPCGIAIGPAWKMDGHLRYVYAEGHYVAAPHQLRGHYAGLAHWHIGLRVRAP